MRYVALGLLIAASPVSAEVKSVSDVGFAVERTVTVDASPERAFAALVQPSLWWSSAHTWSGDAKNLSLDLRAGGCFCEAMPKARGGVEHARVVYFAPGRMLRLSGALGPLQGEAAIGTLTFTMKPEGSMTAITLSYVVGGNLRQGPRNLAAPVDGVLGEQLTRLAVYIDERKTGR